MSVAVEGLVNALRCARLAVSRLEVGAMGWIKEPHPMLGTNMVPVTEELIGIIDRALAAIAMEAREGGDGATRLHAKHDSAGPQDIAQRTQP